MGRRFKREGKCVYLWLIPEKAMAPHSSTLAWRIAWTEEPGRLQSMGSLRVAHNWATSLSPFTFMHWRRKWQPTPVFLPGKSQGREAWWAAIYGVAQSRTRLKWLSSIADSCRVQQNTNWKAIILQLKHIYNTWIQWWTIMEKNIFKRMYMYV